ncbi:MAG: bis(5'-nucleosyl)-tetraphosphatase (symmetrical) [Rubrivivax sp. SCN 71-131]|nr:MAG: bis(5'-nucleosyl)-tetraphosphatase (symmetrical) [Rubrivivax sp. SCN 71-131]
MVHLIGDLQGCCSAFDRLLAEIGFSPSRDRIVVLGDLVNRGPASLQVLQRLRALQGAATCLLGNHDLHLLVVAAGLRRPHRSDTLDAILQAPDRQLWLDWLRAQPLAVLDSGWLCVHAGVPPQWTTADALRLAAEVHALVRGPGFADFLPSMYGDEPRRWHEALTGPERWRFVINALTRMRYCTPQGELEFAAKETEAPPGCMPWYEVPDRATRGQPIAFGHWSAQGLIDRPGLLGLDTGCVWGRQLTAVRVDGGRHEIVQVSCAADVHA